MAARIGLSTGEEFVVEGTVDEVASKMIGPDPFATVESEGARVYILWSTPSRVWTRRPGGS
jgi:predicted Fe-Mo cluster-binding NifX family protein